MGGKHQLTAATNQCRNSIQKSLRRIGTINLRFSRRIGKFGKSSDSAKFLKLTNSFYYKLLFNPVTPNSFKMAKKIIMSKYNLARKSFDLEEYDSDDSDRSLIYISSSEEESSDWETDCSTDTEQLIARIEKEVTSSPMLIGGRIMTMEESSEDELEAGPSSPLIQSDVTPKFDHRYAAPKKLGKSRIEMCKTLLPVPESPMSPPDHERGGQVWTPP